MRNKMKGAASAIASQFAPNSDGVADSSTPAHHVDWNLVLPQSAVNASNAFKGTPVTVDIDIPQNFGKCTDFVLQISATFSDSAGGATGAAAFTLPPAPYWIDHIEYQLGGDTIETTYADSLFAEAVTFQSDQEFHQLAGPLGIGLQSSPINGNSSTEVASLKVYGPATATTPQSIGYNGSLWLPLNGILSSTQPFFQGFNKTWKIRVYLAANVNPTVGWLAADASSGARTAAVTAANLALSPNGTGFRLTQAGGGIVPYGTTSPLSTVSVTLGTTPLQLWVREATLSDEQTEELLRHHREQIVYRTVKRTTWNATLNATGNAGTLQKNVLTNFYGSSAGLYFYLKPQSSAPEDCITRFQVNSMQLIDGGSNPLSPTLPATIVENWISPSSTPLSSYFVNSPNYTTYIFPFASSLNRAIFGKKMGAYNLVGNEQIHYTPTSWESQYGVATGQSASAVPYYGPLSDAAIPVSVNVVSYDYNELMVVGGNAYMGRPVEE